MARGSCLCGAVKIEVSIPLAPADACHCTQCRKQTGHYFASTNVPRDALTVTGEDKVGWYQSSEKVRRGFCTICGSVLFWDPPERDWTSVAMGCFESPTGSHLEIHIFTADKGDYYEIADGVPQRDQ
jgi:hypothetical protein